MSKWGRVCVCGLHISSLTPWHTSESRGLRGGEPGEGPHFGKRGSVCARSVARTQLDLLQVVPVDGEHPAPQDQGSPTRSAQRADLVPLSATVPVAPAPDPAVSSTVGNQAMLPDK